VFAKMTSCVDWGSDEFKHSVLKCPACHTWESCKNTELEWIPNAGLNLNCQEKKYIHRDSNLVGGLTIHRKF